MKKNFIFILIAMLISSIAFSMPAKPGIIEFVQPDGSKISIYLKGDERFHWAKTTDGYTILANKTGFYEYAILNKSGDLELSGVVAKELANRSKSDLLFLSGIKKDLFFSESQLKLVEQIRNIYDQQSKAGGAKAFPTTGTRNLVCILIGFTDKAFTKTQAEFDNLFNLVGYNTDGATGSVKDFFLESSYNQLTLTVTVAGPYTAANNMAYYGGNDANGYDYAADELVTEAANLANPDVNYVNFDNDGNGTVDGVYVIYAGYGEEAGASANAIWAHASSISTITLDGKTISKYSCSSELRGTSGTGLTRIGVICHEFGHVLGAKDYYDTNYNEDPPADGQYDGTGDWDLQAGGSWNNGAATPAQPNAYTKCYVYNWAIAIALTASASIAMNNSAKNSGSFYRIDTQTANEYFLLENKQKVGFDSYLPGHGLIIYHVDGSYISTYTSTNKININSHQGMFPMSAVATNANGVHLSADNVINVSGCTWPGTSNKTTFNDASTPNSKSWAGVSTAKPLINIAEAGGVISFCFMSCAAPTMSNYTPTTLYKDRGKQITITGTNLVGCTFTIGGVSGTAVSNTGTVAVVDFPGGTYTNGTLTVANGSGTITGTIVTNTRTTIPVDAATSSNTDVHKTIDGAMTGLSAWLGATAFTTGYIIEVAAGTYAESATLNSTLAPTSTNKLTIQNATGASPIVNATGQTNGIDLTTVNYVVLKGFTVYGATVNNINVEGQNCEIYYNKTYNAGNSGICLLNALNANLHNNLLYNNTQNGIKYTISNTVTIKNNTIYGNGGSVTPAAVTLLDEGFEGTFPATGWSQYDCTGDASTKAWSKGAFTGPILGTDGSSNYAIIFYDTSNIINRALQTTSVNLTGYASASLEYYVYKSGAYDEITYVEISTNGGGVSGTWTQLAQHGGAGTNYSGWSPLQTVSLNSYVGSTVYVRFRYYQPSNDNAAAVDAIKIKATAVNYFVGNGIYAVSGTGTIIQNNIVSAKTGNVLYYALNSGTGVTVSSSYNTYYTTNTNLFNYNGTIGNTGPISTGDLTGDPKFVTAGTDFHIFSTGGSYHGGEWPPLTTTSGTWTNDASNSPALDAGNPADAYTNEPTSGSRINQGAYGNTVQASKSGVTLPEINVKQVSNIADAGSYNFGSITTGNNSGAITFTIENLGTANLTLTGSPIIAISGTNASDFSIVQTGLSSPIAASGSQTFTITFTPSATGLRTASISIANNDADENPYNITLNGTGVAPLVSEINLKQNTTNIADAGSYDFGNITTGNNSGAITFTIENLGTANLTLTGSPIIVISGTNASDFSIVQTGLSSPIAASGNQTFTITFTPSATGIRTASISIANNDSDENPYNITLNGTGVAPLVSEINLKQNTTNIADAGSYNFGNITTGNNSGTITFTIENLGTANLTLTGSPIVAISGTNASDFSIVQTGLSSPIAASGSQTFTITFTPSATGLRTASISIANNDSDENPYNITLNGTGTINTYTVSGNAGIGNAVVNYTGTSSGFVTANGTGVYSITVNSGDNITITPALSGYTFSPSSQTFNNVTLNNTQDFTAALNTYTISGTTTAGTVISYTGTTTGSVTANGSGVYTMTVNYGWAGTLTPALAGYTFTPASSSIPSVTANITKDFTGTLIIVANTWTGTAWTPQAPTASDDAIINGNYIQTVGFECKDLTINPNFKLEVAPTNTVIVNGNLINNGTIILKSNPITNNATGALLTKGNITGNGLSKAERNLKEGLVQHYMAAPMANVPTTIFAGNSYLRQLTSTGTWVIPSTIMIPMQGYSVLFTTANKMINFQSTISTTQFTTGNQSINTWNGQNLIGNPYPTPIDWNTEAGWTKTNIANIISYRYGTRNATWDGSVSVNGGTRYIPAMQGFVVVSNGASTLAINNNAKVTNATANQVFWKTEVNNILHLKVEGGNYEGDETVVMFNDLATNNYDFESDALKRFEEQTELAHLYTKSNDDQALCINYLPTTNIMDLYFTAGKSDNYTIKATEFNFDLISNVYLEDKLTSTFTNLNNNDYTFTYNINQLANRFRLHFDNINNVDNLNTEIVDIYSSQSDVYINTLASEGTVNIYSLLGVKLVSTNLTNVIHTHLASGVYIVKVQTEKGIYTKNVFINY